MLPSSPDSSSPTRTVSSQRIVAIGAWLFRRRTWLPLPLATALLAAPPPRSVSPGVAWTVGTLLIACGEALRLWAVRHIGVISRTRSERLGPLVATGPFARVRNPLYVGNIVRWGGFGVIAADWWTAGLVALALAIEYHAIVRWEEHLIDERLGRAYREYLASVPRWLPSLGGAAPRRAAATFSWTDTLFSERGTLIAIAIAGVLLYAKWRLYP